MVRVDWLACRTVPRGQCTHVESEWVACRMIPRGLGTFMWGNHCRSGFRLAGQERGIINGLRIILRPGFTCVSNAWEKRRREEERGEKRRGEKRRGEKIREEERRGEER